MSRQPGGPGSSGNRPGRRPPRKPTGKRTGPGGHFGPGRRPAAKPGFRAGSRPAPIVSVPEPVVEPQVPPVGPFRIVLAIHRPRFRGRAVRASALTGWNVTTLLNKQDVVGQVSRGPRPPDIVVLSGDFGRQRDYAIFRAIQAWRKEGMQLVGMVEDCDTAPEGYPDSAPARLCDVCISPPYTAAGIRALLVRLYEERRGEPAPPPVSGAAAAGAEEDEEEID